MDFLLFVLFFPGVLCAVRHVGSSFPDQGSKPTIPAMEAWNPNHLCTGLPGKSLGGGS